MVLIRNAPMNTNSLTIHFVTKLITSSLDKQVENKTYSHSMVEGGLEATS